MESDSTLHDLHHHYAQNQFPAFRCDPRFSSGQARAHNAGFDSKSTKPQVIILIYLLTSTGYITAVLYLKQAHASFSTQKHLDVIDKKCYVPTSQPDQDEKESTGHSNARYVYYDSSDRFISLIQFFLV